MLPAWGRAGNHPCAKERKAVQHAKAHQQAQREVLIEAEHPNMPCGPPMSYVDAKCCEVSCYVQLKGERRVYDFAQFQKEFRKHAKIFSAQEVLAQEVAYLAPIGTLSESELEPNGFSALRRFASRSVLCIFTSPKLMVVPPCVAVLLQQHRSFPQTGVYK